VRQGGLKGQPLGWEAGQLHAHPEALKVQPLQWEAGQLDVRQEGLKGQPLEWEAGQLHAQPEAEIHSFLKHRAALTEWFHFACEHQRMPEVLPQRQLLEELMDLLTASQISRSLIKTVRSQALMLQYLMIHLSPL
jgi:hypothetical protein